MISEIFDYLKRKDFETFIKEVSEREINDAFYGQISDEVLRKDYDPIAYTRAIEKAEGDPQKTQAYYIKFRIVRLRDKMLKEHVRRQHAERARQEDEQHKYTEKTAAQSGEWPNENVRRAYSKEYKDFRRAWVERDYANKYLPETSCVAAFFRERQNNPI